LSDQQCKSPQVLSNGDQNKLVLGTSWTTQSKPAKLQNALQVRKPHLDLLALTPKRFNTNTHTMASQSGANSKPRNCWPSPQY
jgi:hypothetical protein